MRHRHATALRRQGGFTLIEVVITMVVVAVVALIALPAYAQIRKTANIRSLDATVQEAAHNAILQAKVFDTTPADRLTEASVGMAEQCDCALVVDESAGTITVERWNAVRVGTVDSDGTVAIVDGAQGESPTTTTTVPPTTTTTVPPTTTTTAPEGYAGVVLADGPVAYWPLDGSSVSTVPDMTGNGHDGVGFGKINTGKNGVADDAFSFDGRTAFIAVPYDPAIAPSGPWTLELWVHREGGSGWRSLVSNATFGPPSGKKHTVSHTPLNGFVLYSKSGDYRWIGATASQEVTAPAGSGDWVYVVYRYTGAELQLWEDGTMVDSTPMSGFTPNPGVELRIGAGGSGSVSFFYHGFLDEIALYDRALAPNEISDHYLAGQ